MTLTDSRCRVSERAQPVEKGVPGSWHGTGTDPRCLAAPYSSRDDGARPCGWEHHPRGPARPGAPAPAELAQQPLEVLAGGDQLGLDVDLLRPPQAKPPQPVPVLGLGEERFHPDFAFAHRLGEVLGRVVAA